VISSAVPAAAEANGSRLPTEVRQPPPRRARVRGWNAPPRLRPTSGWQPKSSSRWFQVAAAALAVLLVVGGVLAWEYVIPRSTTTPNVLDKTFEEAKAELAARGLRVAQGEPIADRRVAAGHVVQQSVVPGRSARRRSVVEVRLSTGAPFVAIPNLQGKTEGAAKQALAKLRLQVQVNRTQHPQIARGKVISSTPAAPTRIREGSTVTLVVSAGKPLVVVPDVTGQIFQNAQTMLNGAGIAAVQVLEANDQIQPGVVIRTDPPAGTQVERDATVNVVISAGPVVAVPDVRGMNRKDAIRALADLDLQATIGLDSLFGDEVIEQDPAPGTLVQRGSTVRLRLGRRDDNGDND
jgi:serine/threonine-protein kinase